MREWQDKGYEKSLKHFPAERELVHVHIDMYHAHAGREAEE